MDKITYNLIVEPRDRNYCDLIDYALSECKFFLLVTAKNNKQLNLAGKRVLDKLASFLYKLELRSEWPGTIIYGGEVPIYTFHYVRESAEILKKAATGLFQWQRPELPDDLCLLRSDESPWLVTIGHEADSYLELTKDEYNQLIKELPALASMLEAANE